MRFSEKAPMKFSVRTVRREIPLDVSAAKDGGYSVGFSSEGGNLRGGVGAKKVVQAPEGQALSAWFSVGESYALVCESGRVYWKNGDAAAQYGGVECGGEPIAVPFDDGDAGLLVSDGTSSFALKSTGVVQKSAPFTCAAYAYGRLWRTQDGEKLLYSAPNDPFDFTAERGRGGWIDLPDAKGKIVALFARENDIYILREFGLQKLKARGDEREFAVSDVLSCARVVRGSAAATEQALIWLAEDGLHGVGETKIRAFSNLYSGLEQERVRAAAEGDRYYLYASARLGEEKEAVLGVFDVNTGGVYFLREAIRGLVQSGQRAQFVTDEGGCVFAPSGAFGSSCRIWQGACDRPFGERGFLYEAELNARGALVLQVCSEEGSRSVCCAAGSARVAFNLPGTWFAFRILSEDCAVDSLTAVYRRGEGLQ